MAWLTAQIRVDCDEAAGPRQATLSWFFGPFGVDYSSGADTESYEILAQEARRR